MTIEQANAKLMIELAGGHAATDAVQSLIQAAVDAIMRDEQSKMVCEKFGADRPFMVRIYSKALGYWARRGFDPKAIVAITALFGNAAPLTDMFQMLSDTLQKAKSRGKGTPDEVIEAVIDFSLLAIEPRGANAATA